MSARFAAWYVLIKAGSDLSTSGKNPQAYYEAQTRDERIPAVMPEVNPDKTLFLNDAINLLDFFYDIC